LITLQISGNERQFDESALTVTQLVDRLRLEGKRLAIV
jgi:sulfur carrier protein ThiS